MTTAMMVVMVMMTMMTVIVMMMKATMVKIVMLMASRGTKEDVAAREMEFGISRSL